MWEIFSPDIVIIGKLRHTYNLAPFHKTKIPWKDMY